MKLTALMPWSLVVALAVPPTAAASDTAGQHAPRTLRSAVRDRVVHAQGLFGRAVDTGLRVRARVADRRALRTGRSTTTVRGVLRAAVRVDLRDRAVAGAEGAARAASETLAQADRGVAEAHGPHDKVFATRAAIGRLRDNAREAVRESVAHGDPARAARARDAARALERLGLHAGAYMNQNTGKALRAAIHTQHQAAGALAAAQDDTHVARAERAAAVHEFEHQSSAATPGQRHAAAWLHDRAAARRADR